jgi:hypothetical protein
LPNPILIIIIKAARKSKRWIPLLVSNPRNKINHKKIKNNAK